MQAEGHEQAQNGGDARFGVLVGWTAERLGDRVQLRVQSVTTPPPHRPADVTALLLMMDRNQAVQLGHVLFEIAGHRAPERAPAGWLARLFG